jgi:hypothetical protein
VFDTCVVVCRYYITEIYVEPMALWRVFGVFAYVGDLVLVVRFLKLQMLRMGLDGAEDSWSRLHIIDKIVWKVETACLIP